MAINRVHFVWVLVSLPLQECDFFSVFVQMATPMRVVQIIQLSNGAVFVFCIIIHCLINR